MNDKKITDSVTLGIFFSRTSVPDEIGLSSWAALREDILQIAKSANAVLGVHAANGAGKTTFIRQLADEGSEFIDILSLHPTSPALLPGWISQGVGQWLTTDHASQKNLQTKLSALRETGRPILICLDLAQITDPDPIAAEICALLNLADASGTKLSFLLLCTNTDWESFSRSRQISSRIIYSKALPGFSEQELVELIHRKLVQHQPLQRRLDPNLLSKLAQNANGSPLQMIRLVCAELGLDVTRIDDKENRPEKTPKGKKIKNKPDQISIPFDDLLAPNTK